MTYASHWGFFQLAKEQPVIENGLGISCHLGSTCLACHLPALVSIHWSLKALDLDAIHLIIPRRSDQLIHSGILLVPNSRFPVNIALDPLPDFINRR